MKILILSNYDLGLYKFRKELIGTLSDGNDVSAAVPNGGYTEKLEALGCKNIPFSFNRRGMNPFSDLMQMLRYVNLIKKVHPNIVLTYTIKPNVYGGIACRLTKTPYIANVTGLGTSIENGGILAKFTVSLYKIGLKNAGCIFFQNESNRKLFREKHIVSSKMRLIPGSGVNLTEHCLEAYPQGDACIRFLFVGRIMKDKGINELLDAIEIVHDKHNRVSLDIVGGCDEDYLKLLQEKEKSGYIHYHGLQDNVHQFIKNTHCTVLPSYHEGTANVMLESAATGRPVITTRIPGCIETFDEGITGLGCEVKNTSSLVDAMEKFLLISPSEREQMGLRGRHKMEAEYDRDIVVKAYEEEIYKYNSN